MDLAAYLFLNPLLDINLESPFAGWPVDRLYQDIATQPDRRPQWQQLLQDAQAHVFDRVLIRQLEDLGDSLAAVGDRLAELEALGISLMIAQSGANQLTLAPPSTELLQQVQQFQAEQRRQRIRQGHARNRLKTAPPPGKAPYGYRRSKNRYLVDRTTAPVVRDFFEQFLLYGSLSGAVRYVRKRYGKKISVSTGHRWLTSPVYRGSLMYHDGQVIPNTHEAILPPDEAAQVDRLLRRNRRLPPRTASAPHSLTGLVVCAACQSPLTPIRATAPRRAKEYLYLRPARCPQAHRCGSLTYESVLQATIARICEDLPKAVAGAPLPDLDSIKQRLTGAIARQQEILTQLPELVTRQILDQETAELRAYKIRAEMAELQDQLAQLPPVNLTAIAQTVSIPQFWLDLSEAERRFYFREFIQQIQLHRHENQWQLQIRFNFLRNE
jgi:DNA invertase Pin-like site-specific DNA recombinase